MSKNNHQVLVTLNPIGYKLRSNEIETVLQSTTDRGPLDWIAAFFKIKPGNVTEELLIEYAKACDAMENISVGSFHEDIQNKLINTLASAKRCFSYREHLASIELCALHAEMLANFLCIINKECLTSESIIKECGEHCQKNIKKHVKKDDFNDSLNQNNRLEWLLSGGIISNEDYEKLLATHDLRKNFFHHWHQNHNEIENDALNTLAKISKVSSKYLEIINNAENIDKIKCYMQGRFKNKP